MNLLLACLVSVEKYALYDHNISIQQTKSTNNNNKQQLHIQFLSKENISLKKNPYALFIGHEC